MTTKEILIAARAKIEAPERWLRGARAMDHRGSIVSPGSPRATRWSPSGAITVSGGDAAARSKARTSLRAAMKTYRTIDEWADYPDRTHAEVLAAFDRAIAAADSV